MTVRTVTACVFLGVASFAAAQNAPLQRALPHIATPDALAIEMAKALVNGDREQFTALAATREEMEQMLETAQPPATAQARQELKQRVAEILADREADFARFQTLKQAANVRDGVAVRFEIVELDKIYEKDGMRKVRHSRVRMFQAADSFLISLDDMFSFPRGWAFTSVAAAIGREPR